MVAYFKPTLWLYSLICLTSTIDGASVKFSNCIAEPNQLTTSFLADRVEAFFDFKTGLLAFNVSGGVYGNSLVDLSSQTNKYTTLRVIANDIQNTLLDNYSRFCDTVDGECPVTPGPASFHFQTTINATEQLSTLETTFMILSAEVKATIIGCVKVETTEVFKDSIIYSLLFGSFFVFILLGFLFLLSAATRPWPNMMGFCIWNTKYYSDVKHIRVSTPSFLQYLLHLQFLFFLGCMNLDYPGFYQPLLAKFSWSTLLFPLHFVDKSGRWPDLIKDNIYPINIADSGLASGALFGRVRHLNDIWPGAIIWLLVCIALVIVFWHICYLVYRLFFGRPANGRGFSVKEFYNFLLGMIIRLVFIYFAYPILTFTFFQLSATKKKELLLVSSAFAGLFLVIWVLSAISMSIIILKTRPAKQLFENELLLSRFGVLYNFYCEDGVHFLVFEFIFVVIRAMIIGVIQISGIAQIAVLATIEIAYTITVFVIRPFDTRANMNIYLVLMSFMRFISIMLSIAFVSSLGTHFETKSWIAYIIVALNLVVIIAYFLFPALYHIFELVILYKKNGRLSARPTQVYGHSKLARRRYEEIADNPSQSQSPLLSKEHKADPNISTSNFEGHARKAHEVKVNLTINTNFSNNGFSAVSPSSSTPGTPAEATTLTPSNFTMNKQMNIAHNGFYRPPRHRTSYDRVSPGYHSSQSPIYKKVDEKYSRNNDNEEFDFFNDEKKKKPDKKTKEEVKDPLGRVNVNYAIRESDLYYKPAGLFDDDVIENNSKVSHLNGGKRGNAVAVNDSANDVGSDRTTNIPNDDDISNQSLLNNAALHRKSTTLSTDYDTYQSVISLDTLTEKKVDNVGKSQRVGKKQGFFTSIQGWVSLNIKAPSRTTQNANSENPVDDLSPRGFEVLHRGPIKAMPQTEAGNVIAKNT